MEVIRGKFVTFVLNNVHLKKKSTKKSLGYFLTEYYNFEREPAKIVFGPESFRRLIAKQFNIEAFL